MQERLTEQEHLLRTILDTIPSYVFVVDYDLRFLHANRAATNLLGDAPQEVLKRLCGEALHCLNANHPTQGCGLSGSCSDCVIRNSVASVRGNTSVFRERTRMRLQRGNDSREAEFLVTACPMTVTNEPLVLLILEDITELARLRGLLPICAGCKKIRNDREYWEDVSGYLSQHTDLRFTHGLCPDCIPKYFPELASKPSKP